MALADGARKGHPGPSGGAPAEAPEEWSGADHEPAVRVVPHHHSARVAGQAAGRFRGNVRAALEDGLAGRLRVRQHGGVDVDDDLVALARRAGIDPVVEGGLRQHG